MARQTSTSRPVQLPLSSGEAKPGRPGLTPQDSMPRSWMVLRVWAVAVCAERAAAAVRVRTRDTRFMGKAFRGVVRGTLPRHVRNGPTPDDPCYKMPSKPAVAGNNGGAMDRRSRQAPQLAATWIVGAITERLASRVKGLTADFCVLLLARKPRRCRQIRYCALRLRQKVFGANA